MDNQNDDMINKVEQSQNQNDAIKPKVGQKQIFNNLNNDARYSLSNYDSGKRKQNIVGIVLFVLLAPLWIALIIVAVACVLVIFACLITVVVASIGLVLGGLYNIISAFVVMGDSASIGVVVLGMGVAGLGLGIAIVVNINIIAKSITKLAIYASKQIEYVCFLFFSWAFAKDFKKLTERRANA